MHTKLRGLTAGSDYLQAIFLTEIRGKEQKTYKLSSTNLLELQRQAGDNKQGGSDLLTGLKGTPGLQRQC